MKSVTYILSRSLLYAVVWFLLWVLYGYLRGAHDFRHAMSSSSISLCLFVGWLCAVLNWRTGADEKGASERTARKLR